MAEKPTSRLADEPCPGGRAKTLGEALDEIGFVPASGVKRIIVPERTRTKRLTRWRKTGGQD